VQYRDGGEPKKKKKKKKAKNKKIKKKKKKNNKILDIKGDISSTVESKFQLLLVINYSLSYTRRK
jgi:hypothetical protein